jgi:hypothetical protein
MSSINNQPDIHIHFHGADAGGAAEAGQSSAPSQAESFQQMLGLMKMMMQMMQMMNSSPFGQPPSNPIADLLGKIFQQPPSTGDNEPKPTRGGDGPDKAAGGGEAGAGSAGNAGGAGTAEPSIGREPLQCGTTGDLPAGIGRLPEEKPQSTVEQTLLDNFDKLKGSDDLVTLQTVNEVAQGMNCPNGEKPSAELQKACQAMVENPSAFKAIETFDNPDAPADMKIGSGDLEAVLKEASLKSERTILDNFDQLAGSNGLITLQTINEVAAGGNCPDGSVPSPELRAACQDMVANPEKFKTAETAAPGAPQDMLLGTGDLQTLLA